MISVISDSYTLFIFHIEKAQILMLYIYLQMIGDNDQKS